MKRSRFSEEQIIGILKEHQADMSAADLCRFSAVVGPDVLGGVSDINRGALAGLSYSTCSVE